MYQVYPKMDVNAVWMDLDQLTSFDGPLGLCISNKTTSVLPLIIQRRIALLPMVQIQLIY